MSPQRSREEKPLKRKGGDGNVEVRDLRQSFSKVKTITHQG